MPQPIRSAYTIPQGGQFGAPREGGRHHQGTDYHAPIGTPIYATGDGHVVANVGETGVGIGFGNYVSIAYAHDRMTLDGHLRERSSLPTGTVVGPDTIVGYLGTTGNAIYANPPGSHDHHQVWINGNLVDPVVYYDSIITPAGSGGTPIIQEEEDVKLRFVTANTTSPWYVTNGLTKRVLAPGEDQTLVDLGLAVREVDGGGVKQIGQVAIDRIANA